MKIFTKIAAGFFTLFTLIHVFRLLQGWEVQIRGAIVPLWASYIFIGVGAVMALGLWKESK